MPLSDYFGGTKKSKSTFHAKEGKKHGKPEFKSKINTDPSPSFRKKFGVK